MRIKKKSKRKRRISIGELAGFSILTLFIIFVLYLFIPPQITQHPTTQSETSTPFTTSVEKPPLKAAIVDQLSLQHPNPEFIDSVQGILLDAQLETEIINPEGVTVNMYGALASHDYKLIIFRVHAGVNDQLEGNPVGLFTAEPYSELKYPQEQLTDLVAPAQAFNGSDIVFCVTPKFIRERTVLDYSKSIIILTGCYGLYSPDLPQAFIERGASVVIGWDGLVDIEHTDRAILILVKALLLERKSVQDSVEMAMSEVGPDPNHGSRLGYYPLDKEDETFHNLFLTAFPIPVYVREDPP